MRSSKPAAATALHLADDFDVVFGMSPAGARDPRRKSRRRREASVSGGLAAFLAAAGAQASESFAPAPAADDMPAGADYRLALSPADLIVLADLCDPRFQDERDHARHDGRAESWRAHANAHDADHGAFVSRLVSPFGGAEEAHRHDAHASPGADHHAHAGPASSHGSPSVHAGAHGAPASHGADHGAAGHAVADAAGGGEAHAHARENMHAGLQTVDGSMGSHGGHEALSPASGQLSHAAHPVFPDAAPPLAGLDDVEADEALAALLGGASPQPADPHAAHALIAAALFDAAHTELPAAAAEI